METLQRQALLLEVEQLIVEARSGLHGGAAFLDGLGYGLTLAGLMDDPEVKRSWAHGEALADQSLQRTSVPWLSPTSDVHNNKTPPVSTAQVSF